MMRLMKRETPREIQSRQRGGKHDKNEKQNKLVGEMRRRRKGQGERKREENGERVERERVEREKERER